METIKEVAPSYKYSFVGVILCALNIRHSRQRRFFCSEFVAYMLKEAGIAQFDKDICFVRPIDFIKLPGANLVYQGRLKHCDDEQAENVDKRSSRELFYQKIKVC